MNLSKARLLGMSAAAALALVLVQAALAADKQPIRFNAPDQAAAKAVTVKAADLGAGWKGGVKKPDLTPDDTCVTKVSDLVVTGAAKSEFTAPAVVITSESQVLLSPALVGADWRRSIGNAAFMSCTRREVMKTDDAKVVSFKKVAFPQLTQYAARYRMVADFGKAGSSVRGLVDIIALGQDRTEISLVVTTRYADRAAADLVEKQLAKILVSRIAA
jgi:hypothetical protein